MLSDTLRRQFGSREDGDNLPAYAWPGGYPIYYVTRRGEVLCPDCANEEADPEYSYTVIDGADVNYRDPELYCECGQHIPAAYVD